MMANDRGKRLRLLADVMVVVAFTVILVAVMVNLL